MNVTRVPVLIVGAGAAGLATSALLAQHGVRSLLVEKRREVFIYPKARNLSFRSLEILRGLGLGDEVHHALEAGSRFSGAWELVYLALLAAAIVAALADPAVLARIRLLGADPMPTTPEAFGRFIRGEYDKWAKVVAETGTKGR